MLLSVPSAYTQSNSTGFHGVTLDLQHAGVNEGQNPALNVDPALESRKLTQKVAAF